MSDKHMANNNIEFENDEVTLKRSINLFGAVTLISGVIIGSGIFVSPKGVLIETGSVGGSLIIWAVCGLICVFGALTLAELGCLNQSSGGIYSYIKDAFGDFWGFLYLWTSVWVVFPAANAAIAMSCAYYLLQPFYPCGAPLHLVIIIAILAISFLTFINCASVSLATKVQELFAVIKILALIIIIGVGLYVLCLGSQKGHTQNFDNIFSGSTTDPGRISLAFYSGMFSYSGWYTLNFLYEEMKNPFKNLPRAIWISMPLVTIIYVLVNVAYFAVLTSTEIIQSEAVAVSLAEKTFGVIAWCMPLLVAMSCFGSLNGCILSVSRMFYVGAREGHLPQMLNLINYTKFTPIPSILFEGLISIALCFIGDLYLLINSVSFVESLSFTLATLALFKMRITHPDAERPIKVNLIIPAIFFLVCIFLVVYPIFTNFRETSIGLAILATGIPAYILCIMWEKKPQYFLQLIDHGTYLTQLLFLSIPTTEDKLK